MEIRHGVMLSDGGGGKFQRGSVVKVLSIATPIWFSVLSTVHIYVQFDSWKNKWGYLSTWLISHGTVFFFLLVAFVPSSPNCHCGRRNETFWKLKVC